MKPKLILLFVLVTALSTWAQLPTAGLVAQYDMVTLGGGGTTLTDLSGNSNTGTLHNTTSTAYGLTFDGATSWVSIPVLINNSDFTAIAIAQPGGTGAIWAETTSTESPLIRFSSYGGTQTTISSSVFGGQPMPFAVINQTPDWDVFFMSRNTFQMTSGKLSRVNQSATWSLPSNVSTASITKGALGVEDRTSSQITFWTGQLAYFVLYNRHLSLTEMRAAYIAMAAAVLARPIFVHPWPADYLPAITAPVWQRQGAVLNWAPGGQICGEPEVIWDTNPQLIAGTNVFKMWCTSAGTIAYAESPDGVNWTTKAAALLSGLGTGGAGHIKVGSTYHHYVVKSGNHQIDHYTSPDGITFTLANAAVLGVGATWDTQLNNPHVYYNASLSPSWYMMWEGTNDTTSGGATSTDGATWTKSTANPFFGALNSTKDQIGASGEAASCGGPWFTYVNNLWWMWCGQTQINRYVSPTFNGFWLLSTPGSHPAIRRNGNSETQVADPSLVEVNGKTYMFIGTGGVSGDYSPIKLFIANMPLSQLVETTEGTTSDQP